VKPEPARASRRRLVWELALRAVMQYASRDEAFTIITEGIAEAAAELAARAMILPRREVVPAVDPALVLIFLD
jgi:hypothetical protein